MSETDWVFLMTMKREFIRYAGVGGLAFIADFSLLALLTFAGLHYLSAALLAFLLGSWVNYRLSVRWVFAYRAIEARGAEFGLFLRGLLLLRLRGFIAHIFALYCCLTHPRHG